MYEKIVRYRFKVCDTPIDITEIDESDEGVVVAIEEVEKNGQEDTHMSGALLLDGSGWRWIEGRRMFVDYGSERLATAILEFLKTNGLPKIC